MPTPTTVHLTFTLARAERLAAAASVDLGTWLRRAAGERKGRRELASRASGVHDTREEAVEYARREGPAFVLAPDGEVLRIERARDAQLDAAAATEERAHAEQNRRLTFRQQHGPAGASARRYGGI